MSWRRGDGPVFDYTRRRAPRSLWQYVSLSPEEGVSYIKMFNLSSQAWPACRILIPCFTMGC